MTYLVLLGISLSAAMEKSPALKAAVYLPGEWQLVSSTFRGDKRVEKFSVKTDWTIDKDQVTMSWVDKSRRDTRGAYHLKVDFTSSPMHFDRMHIEGPFIDGLRETTSRGIMFVEKDTLTICAGGWGRGGGVRPPGFQSTKENGETIYVFERVKAKPPK